jgi:hypothetical protein
MVFLLKDMQPCKDCKQAFPAEVMEYDHVGPDKSANVSMLVNQASPAKVLAEIAKCDLVCANCHRIRTACRRRSL